MEAIGAGASVLAFITLGLQSVKTIHEILSSVKDTTRVYGVRQDVQGLQATLDRLSRCRAVAELRDDALATKIEKCAGDLKTFAERLVKLAIDGSEHRLERQVKKLKGFLNEKELKDMGDAIVRHTTSLSLHLKVLESDALFELRDGLAAVKEDVSVYRTGQAMMTADQTSTLSTLDAIKKGTQDIQESIRAGNTQYTAQVNEFMRMFTQISEQLGALSVSHRVGSGYVEETPDAPQPDAGTSPEEVVPFSEVFQGIQSIVTAARDKAGVFAHKEAQEMADALVSLLQTLMSDQFLDSLPQFTAAYQSWCETCTKHDLADLRQNLRTVQGTLLSSRKMSLNAPSKRAHPGDSFDHAVLKYRSYDLGFGVVSFLSAERAWKRRLAHKRPPPQASESSTDVIEEMETRISFIPQIGAAKRLEGFHTVIRQFYSDDGSTRCSTIPRLSVNRILPADSQVFTVVRSGHLREFQEMLMSGTASLRDQDERGASLLFYANEQPEICRFLLQHGADVDHYSSCLAGGFDGLGAKYAATALSVDVNDNEAEERLKPILECRKMLLQAGCDPTLPVWNVNTRTNEGDESSSTFYDGTPESMRILLDYSAGFVTIESIVDAESHHTPLLQFCAARDWTPEGVSVLLDRGANVHARDRFGKTCLALCVGSLASWRPWFLVPNITSAQRLAEPRDVLLMLIRRGADVLAVDYTGLSVSEIAYLTVGDEGLSVAGDLWDVVLADCQLDVASFRAACGIRRRPRYGKWYTRELFEDLWRGREHLCPYFYDDEEGLSTDGEEFSAESSADGEMDNTDDDSSFSSSDDDDDADSEGGAQLEDTNGEV